MPKYTITVTKFDETNEAHTSLPEELLAEDLVVIYQGGEHADAPLNFEYEDDGSAVFYLE